MSEYCCGAVVYTRQENEFRFVLVKNEIGIYGFPKGHMEAGETELETAAREIQEETGLTVRFVDGFVTHDAHPLPNTDVMKHITYFLATYENQTPVYQQDELTGVELLPYETALNRFQFESSKRILTDAWTFMQENHIV